MAGRIQGITVEIGGDTTKLQTALKGVNSEIRNTQSQLKDVDKLLKLDPGNTELLAQKHRLLGDAVKETKEKLETLKNAYEQCISTSLRRGVVMLQAIRIIYHWKSDHANCRRLFGYPPEDRPESMLLLCPRCHLP